MSPDEKPSEQETQMIRAEQGKAYPIRLMHFMDGTLIIGFVISVQPDHMMLLHPYEVRCSADEDDNIVEYELEPYMDQLAEFDPESMTPVPFCISGTISPAIVPAQHLRTFYSTQVQLKMRESMIDRGVRSRRPVTKH